MEHNGLKKGDKLGYCVHSRQVGVSSIFGVSASPGRKTPILDGLRTDRNSKSYTYAAAFAYISTNFKIKGAELFVYV